MGVGVLVATGSDVAVGNNVVLATGAVGVVAAAPHPTSNKNKKSHRFGNKSTFPIFLLYTDEHGFHGFKEEKSAFICVNP